jgi:hypothetical protein
MRKNVVLGSKATATFTSQSGKQERLTMRGNWFDTQADIIDEAQNSKFFFFEGLALKHPFSMKLTQDRPCCRSYRPQVAQRKGYILRTADVCCDCGAGGGYGTYCSAMYLFGREE